MANIDRSKLDELIPVITSPFFTVHKNVTVATGVQLERIATDSIVRGDDATMVL